MQKRSNVVYLAKLRQGDPKAVQQWFEEFSPKMHVIALSKVSNPAIAEEIVQETFINCLRQLHLFKGEAQLWTWMQSILRHEIADYYRKKYAKKAIKVLPLSELFIGVEIHDSQVTSEKVKSTLENMTATQRELLLMKYVDRQKVKDIAQQLGRSVKAVESDLFRARGEFKQVYTSLD